MNERDRLENILDGNPVDRPACICPMNVVTGVLMNETGISYPEYHYDADKMCRLAKAGNTLAGFESVRIPLDESTELSAFGVEIAPGKIGTHPIILRQKVRSLDAMERLEVPDAKSAGRMPITLQAVKELQDWRTDLPILLGIVSPLMLAIQLRGDHNILFDMHHHPDLLKRFLNTLTEFDLDYLKLAFENGADHIVIDDGLSGGDFLDEGQFRTYAVPYEDMIANECRKYDFETILHVCGDSKDQIPRMLEVNADGISVDHDVSVASTRRLVNESKRRTAIIGNLCPSRTLLLGGREKVVEMTKRAIDEGVDAVAPGCNLEMLTPLENIRAMVSTTKSYDPLRRKGIE
jgi:MtaA/CmuA family methyltransferase